MPALDALTFDIGMNTEAFERGAQNVEEVLRNLLSGAFHNLAQSVENISQSLTGVTGSSAQMTAALSESGKSAATAFSGVIDASGEMNAALVSSAQQSASALANTGDVGQQVAKLLAQSGSEASESFRALFSDLSRQGEAGAEAINTIMRALSQGGQINTEVLNALIAALTQTGQAGTEAIERLTEALSRSGSVGAESMAAIQSAIVRVGQQSRETATHTTTLWENAAKRIEFSMRQALRSFVGPMAAVFGVSTMFNSYTGTADRLGKMSKSLEFNLADLQGWSEAAIRAGGSAEGFQGSLRSLNRQLQMMSAAPKGKSKGASAGAGAGGLGQLLQEMKINAKDAKGKTKDVFELLKEIAYGAEKMGGQQFAGLAMRSRIDQGTIQLLQMGGAAVEKLVARQKELGGYTEEDAKVAADFKDALADLTQVFKMFAAIIMRAVTPVLTVVAKTLTSIFEVINKKKGLVLAFIGTVAVSLASRLIPAIKATGSAAGTALRRIGIAWKTLLGQLIIPVVLIDLFEWLTDTKGKKRTNIGWLINKLIIYGGKLYDWFAGFSDYLKGLWDDFVAGVIKKWNAFLDLLPEGIKRQLGLVEVPPEQKLKEEEEAEYQLLVAEDPNAGIGLTLDDFNKLREEAKKNVRERREKAARDNPPSTISVSSEVDKEKQARIQARADELVMYNYYDEATAQKQAREENGVFDKNDVRYAPEPVAAPKANDVSAESQLSTALAHFGEMLTIVASQQAQSAIAPVVNNAPNEVVINNDMRLTQNVTTEDPKKLADGVAAPLKVSIENSIPRDLIRGSNGGVNFVSGGTIVSK